MGTVVVIVLVLVAAAVVLGRRSDSAREPESVGTTGASSAAPSAPADVAPVTPQSTGKPEETLTAPAVAPTSAPPPSSGAVTVVLSLTRPCWVAATVDGRAHDLPDYFSLVSVTRWWLNAT